MKVLKKQPSDYRVVRRNSSKSISVHKSGGKSPDRLPRTKTYSKQVTKSFRVRKD